MDLSPYKTSEKKTGGPLKTTTWGTLIALSLLLTGLAVTGHLSHKPGNPQVIQTAENIAPDQVPALSSAVRDSYDAKPNRRTWSSA